MSKQDEARAIAAGLDHSVTTSRGKVIAEVTCVQAVDARRVLSAFGRKGWKTSVDGYTIRAEHAL